MGKGSARRTPSPYCTQDEFSKNWDAIFKKSKPQKKNVTKKRNNKANANANKQNREA